MKWQNKGHEFDELGVKFKKVKKIIVFGDDFEQANYYINKDIKSFLNFLNCEIEFIKINKKYVHNNILFKAYLSYLNKTKKLDIDNNLILAHYNCKNNKKIRKLKRCLTCIFQNALVYDSCEFFERYLSVFSIYNENKAYVRDMCVVVTTVCTLNCKYCLNFTPFIKNPEHTALDELKEEAKIFFSKVDKVGFFQITGGEPLTYKHLKEYIEWLDDNYKNQMGQILLATNGTLLPDDELTKVFKERNIILLLDNYTLAVPRTKKIRDDLIEHLKSNKIDFRNYGDKQEFFKFFPANEDYSKWDENKLIERADKCWQNQPWRNVKDGKVHLCNYTSFAVTAGIIEDDKRDYFDLREVNQNNKIEMVEFLLGYSELGYDTFCKLCNGINIANTLPKSIAGEQLKGKYDYNSNLTLAEYEKFE